MILDAVKRQQSLMKSKMGYCINIRYLELNKSKENTPLMYVDLSPLDDLL